MRASWLLLTGGALAAAPLIAQSANTAPGEASAQGDLAVTIYNNNLALVQDIRQMNVPAGASRQEFPDVSAAIRPETVSLTGADFGIIEQNFDYDLLSPGKLMEKAVGQTVTLLRTNPATGVETRERAKVLATNGGVVIQVGERIEVLRDDGLPVRVIFDRVPPNLRAKPTLSVTMDSTRAGTRPLTLSYLTTGLGWRAGSRRDFDATHRPGAVVHRIFQLHLVPDTGAQVLNGRGLRAALHGHSVADGKRLFLAIVLDHQLMRCRVELLERAGGLGRLDFLGGGRRRGIGLLSRGRGKGCGDEDPGD